MAKALRKSLVCFLNHPRLDVPVVLSQLKYITDLQQLERYFERLTAASEPHLAKMTAVERPANPKLYHYGRGWASAVRLFGADDEMLPRDRVTVRYNHTPLIPPPELIDVRDKTVQFKREQAYRNGQVFFNGPNARLVSWRASPRDGYGTARELNFLELDLGPVGWYDFEGLNEGFRETVSSSGAERAYQTYVGLADLLANGDVSKARLSNILDNAITILTIDGFLAFQERGKRVASVPGKLSSAVAENVNLYLDETYPGSPDRLMHSLLQIESLDENELGHDYRSSGVSHPFAAAERGIAEEKSFASNTTSLPRVIPL